MPENRRHRLDVDVAGDHAGRQRRPQQMERAPGDTIPARSLARRKVADITVLVYVAPVRGFVKTW